MSQYIYWRDRLGWEIGFEEFLDRKDAQNVQTKRIVGRSQPEQAKEVLQERFTLVGTVEDFSSFLMELENVTGRKGLANYVMRRNVSPRADEADELQDRYRERILEANAADLAVYEYVQNSLAPHHDPAGLQGPNSQRQSSRDWRLLTDYMIRKAWLQPATAALRMANGLGPRGTYGQVRRDG